jgi:hypothetical protein
MDLRSGPLGGAQQLEWWMIQHPGEHAIANNWISIEVPRGTDVTAARRALDIVSARHEALRTTVETDAGGTPLQVVHPPAPVEARVHEFVDDRRCTEFREALRWHEFDPSAELPFLAGLVVERERVRELMVCLPHVIVDGWSRRILLRELSSALAEVAGGRDPGLPAPAAQPLDLADRSGPDTAAARFWRDQFDTMQTRMFASATNPAALISAEHVSALAPLVLAQVARQERVGPSVVYQATVHALLACLSGLGRSVVRTHVSGRDAAMDGVVGCFHRVLPIGLDLSDRPPLSEIIRRTWTRMLRAQSRSQLDYLRLRACMAEAEARRGALFARGTTVNFAPGRDDMAEFSDSSADPAALRALAQEPGTAELRTFERGTSVDLWGMDCYLQVRFRDQRMFVGSSFNEEVFTKPQMLVLLHGPERLLLRYLELGDVAFADVAKVVDAPDQPAHDPDVVALRGHVVRLSAITALLAEHPRVAAVRVAVEPSGVDSTEVGERRLIAYVTSFDSGLNARELRDFVFARLVPTMPVACPDAFVIEPGTASLLPDREDAASQRRRERALAEAISHICATRAVGAVGAAGELPTDASYLDAGGELIKAPAVLRELAERGYGGLFPDDFLRPVPLRVLASMMEPA